MDRMRLPRHGSTSDGEESSPTPPAIPLTQHPIPAKGAGGDFGDTAPPDNRNGQMALNIALGNSAFQKKMKQDAPTAGRLRQVSKGTKQKVDAANLITPHTWAVLHSLREVSFKQLMANMGVPDAQPAFEKTGSKYDPAAYGDGPAHTWVKNCEWLSDISKQFDQVVLTAIPLTREKIVRRESSQKHGAKPQFSALAREIAYLFLIGGYTMQPGEEAIGDSQVQYLVRTAATVNEVVQQYKTVLVAVLKGDATAVSPGAALAVFRALGITCSEAGMEGDQKELAEFTKGADADLMRIVEEYRRGQNGDYRDGSPIL
ncbi:hypothetical protein EKD04_017390 [Chloroflexales bacterium ZM16-3]|nr:hypothetical protein [Chloroflexales bacterium ZM16-3]